MKKIGPLSIRKCTDGWSLFLSVVLTGSGACGAHWQLTAYEFAAPVGQEGLGNFELRQEN